LDQWNAREVPDNDYAIPDDDYAISNSNPESITQSSLAQDLSPQGPPKIPTEAPPPMPEPMPTPEPTPIMTLQTPESPSQHEKPIQQPAPQTSPQKSPNAQETNAIPQSPVHTNLAQHNKSAIERKQIGFNMLKEWDESQRHDLLFIKNLTDTIFQRLEVAMKLSYQRITSVIQLFERLQLDAHFWERENKILQLMASSKYFDPLSTAHSSNSPSNKIETNSNGQPSKDSNTFEMGCYQGAMLEFERGRRIWCDAAKKFSNNIQETIMKSILTQDLFAFESNIKTIHNKMNDTRKLLKKESDKTYNKMKDFMGVYTSGLELNKTEDKRIQKDTFTSLNDFISNIQSLYDLTKDIGILTVNFWEHGETLDSKRFNAIKTAFITYFSMVDDTYGESSLRIFSKCKEYIQVLDPIEIANASFGLKTILVQQELEMMNKCLKRIPGELRDVKEYFDGLNGWFKGAEYFWYKKWDVKLSGKPVTAFMTIDDFLVVYGTKVKKNDRLKFSTRIEATQIEIKAKKLAVSISYAGGGFFNMTKTKSLLFENPDLIEEFAYYLRQVKTRRGLP
jgi:hypothetical protein